VVNYECPDDEKAYLHRIGRTGRAGKDGVAVTFVDWRDMHRWKLIDQALGLAQAEPAETYSTSDHLYTELSIPRSVSGTLPRAMRSRAGLDAEDVEDIGETGRQAAHGGPDLGGRNGSRRRGSATSPTGRKAGGRGGADRSSADVSEHNAAAPRERTRTRRRTRGGQETMAAEAQTPGEAHENAAPAGPVNAAAAAPAAGGTEPSPRARRRRTRGSQSAS
jgi:superfamily II DNA/RNA helicase